MIKFICVFFVVWYALSAMFPATRQQQQPQQGVAGSQSAPSVTVESEDDSRRVEAHAKFIQIQGLLKGTINRGIDVNTSTQITHAVLKSSRLFQVDPFLILGVIYAESNARPEARNGACLGLMQVMPKFWDYQLREANIIRHKDDYLQIEPAVMAGSFVLSNCLNRAGNNVQKALRFYTGSRPSESYLKKATGFMKYSSAR